MKSCVAFSWACPQVRSAVELHKCLSASHERCWGDGVVVVEVGTCPGSPSRNASVSHPPLSADFVLTGAGI